MPHPDERCQSSAAIPVIGDELLDTFDAVIEVNGGQQAIGRRAGNVVDPDAPAGVIDLAEQDATGLNLGSPQTHSSADFGSHAGQRRFADPDLVAILGFVAHVVVRPSEPHGSGPARPSSDLAEASDCRDHGQGARTRAVTGEGVQAGVEEVSGKGRQIGCRSGEGWRRASRLRLKGRGAGLGWKEVSHDIVEPAGMLTSTGKRQPAKQVSPTSGCASFGHRDDTSSGVMTDHDRHEGWPCIA
jgi:hypothetical protein